MSAVPITRTAYTELAPASAQAFTAQARGPYGMEILFAADLPAVSTPGVRVPGGYHYGVTRANGDGALYAKIPADSPAGTTDTVIIVGIPADPPAEPEEES